MFLAASVLLAGDVSGKWAGTIERTTEGSDTPDRVDQHYIELKQEGVSIRGTAGPKQAQWKIENGKIDADHIVFEVAPPGAPFTLVYDLTVADGELRGTLQSKGGERKMSWKLGLKKGD